MEELEKVCQPLVKYLKDNYDPYTEIAITMDSITVKRDVEGIPVNKKVTGREISQ